MKLKDRYWDEKDLVALQEAAWNIHFNLENVMAQHNFTNYLVHEEVLAFALIVAEYYYLKGKREDEKVVEEMFHKVEHFVVEENNRKARNDEELVGYKDGWRMFAYESVYDIENFCNSLANKRSSYFATYNNDDNYDFFIDDFTYNALRCCGNKEKRLQLRQYIAPVIMKYMDVYSDLFSRMPRARVDGLITKVVKAIEEYI